MSSLQPEFIALHITKLCFFSRRKCLFLKWFASLQLICTQHSSVYNQYYNGAAGRNVYIINPGHQPCGEWWPNLGWYTSFVLQQKTQFSLRVRWLGTIQKVSHGNKFNALSSSLHVSSTLCFLVNGCISPGIFCGILTVGYHWWTSSPSYRPPPWHNSWRPHHHPT